MLTIIYFKRRTRVTFAPSIYYYKLLVEEVALWDHDHLVDQVQPAAPMIYQRRAAPPITRKVEGDGHLRLDIDGSGQSSRLRDIGRRWAMQHVWCRVPPRAWPRHAKDTWLGLGLGLGLG